MNARESRIMAERVINDNTTGLRGQVDAAVKKAASKGKFSCTLYEVDYKHVETVTKALQADGYRVNFFSGNQRDGNSLTVSW